MILRLFRKNTASDAVFAVYRAIVAQSRRAVFYAEWGVPDTVTGRFDMICLHLVLLFRRLKAEGDAAQEFSQAVFDLFFRDMDRSLREMGVTDLGVPRKIKQMGNLFYGLLASLSEALDGGSREAIEAVIVRNVASGDLPLDGASLAGYLLDEAERLARVPVADILSGRMAEGAAA